MVAFTGIEPIKILNADTDNGILKTRWTSSRGEGEFNGADAARWLRNTRVGNDFMPGTMTWIEWPRFTAAGGRPMTELDTKQIWMQDPSDNFFGPDHRFHDHDDSIYVVVDQRNASSYSFGQYCS